MKRRRDAFRQRTRRPTRFGLRPGIRRRLFAPRLSKKEAKKILRDAKELKGVDFDLFLDPVIATTTTNGSAFTLNAMAAGATGITRVGRKANMKSIRLWGAARWAYVPGASAVIGNWNHLRMVVVWDKQPGGVLPDFEDIFGTSDAAGETTDELDPVKFGEQDRYQIVRDVRIPFNHSGVDTTTTTDRLERVALFDEFVNLRGRETVYSGVGGAVSDISSGGLYVYFRARTNSTADPLNQITILGESRARLRFTG